MLMQKKRIINIIVILATIVLWHGIVMAQLGLPVTKDLTQYSHEAWQSEDGLPQNSISCILQSHDGYLWLGTLEGLVRFDGVRFTVFDAGNTGALQSNRIVSLCEDRTGNLWIGTEGGGVTRMSNGKFTTFTTTEGLFANVIGQICEDKDGTIWFAHSRGISFYKNGTFSTLSRSDGLPGTLLGPICSDREGYIWLGSDSGLIRYDGKKFKLYTTKDGLHNSEFFSLYPGNHGELWIGTAHGLIRFQNEHFTTWTTADGLTNDFIWSICERKDGGVLIGTQGGGLNMWKNGKIYAFTTEDGLTNNVVWSLLEDREGLIWIGTNGGGLNRLKNALFTTYGKLQGLVNDFVWSICQAPNGDFWFGTYEGVSRYSNGKFYSYTTKDGLSSNFIWSVFADNSGGVWVGTSMGLNKFVDGKFKEMTILDGYKGVGARSIIEDRDGTLWVGTTHGVTRLPAGHSAFVPLKVSNAFSNKVTMSICESRDGSMWFGTATGLVRYKNGKSTVYSIMDGLSNEIIRSLYEDAERNLWIGTQGGGLNLYRNGTFTAITQRHGLHNNVVSQILEDDDGDLWMSCNKGIFRVHRKDLLDFAEGKITTITSYPYGKDDGMKSPECNGSSQPAGWKALDGKLWFPTIKGVVVVNPQQENLNTYTPPVIIENILINKSQMSEFDQSNIPVGSGDLEIEYTGISFYAPEKVSFQYKLTGYDDNWKVVGGRRTAYFTNLAPGTYTFRVTTGGKDSVDANLAASVTFRLLPHFYQETWFYTVCALMIGTLSYGGYRLRMLQGKRREQKLIQLVKDRTLKLEEEKENAEEARENAERLQRLAEEANTVKSEILHIAAHDMKSPLISIKMYAQIIGVEADPQSQVAGFADDIYQNSQRMLDLINELLDASAIENGKIILHKTRINITKLADSVVYNQKKTAERKNQMMYLESSGDYFIEADESRIRQVIDNLLSNAIKYSPEGKSIWVRIRSHFDNIRIEICDEGPGLNEEDLKKVFGKFQRLTPRPTGGEPSTGLGLSVVKHLVEIQDGKVWVESIEGKGCNFVVEFKSAKMSGTISL